MLRLKSTFAFMSSALLCHGPALAQAEGKRDTPSEEITLPRGRGLKKGAPERSYFLIGPKMGAQTPKNGYGLLLVLPGGSGGRDFHSFVKAIYKRALGDEWIVAQPIAIEWSKSKTCVWPTRKDAVKGLVSGTEVFVEDVITDVARRQKLDPARILLLAWSSGGPAAYTISLQKYKSVTGFFVAMSVFQPEQLPSLKEAKGEAYVIYHSPEDMRCPFRMAKEAESTLKKAGARVKFVTYSGGHGWTGNTFEDLRDGFRWLEENHARPNKKMWPKQRSRKKRS